MKNDKVRMVAFAALALSMAGAYGGDCGWRYMTLAAKVYGISNLVNAATVKVSASGTNLTVSGVNDLKDLTELDLRSSVEDGSGKRYAIVAIGSSAFKDNQQLTKLYVPDTLTNLGDSPFSSSTITTITPFLPAAFSTPGSRVFQESVVEGDLKICNPDLTDFTGIERFRGSPKLGSVDFTGSSLRTISSRACFYGCSCLTNVTFPVTFEGFGNVQIVFGGNSNLRRVRFRGNPPTAAIVNPMSGTYLGYYLPKWNKTWESYLAEATDCTVTEMSAKDYESFQTGHPGESLPVQKVSIANLLSSGYVKWWYPDAPRVNEPVMWLDALGYDEQTPTVSAGDETLFDGTYYTLSTKQTDFCWTCADGHAAEIAIPAAATTARGLKLTKYRLHQMSVGTNPNGRAPTAWTLWGKKLGAADWTVVDTVAMSGESEKHWAYFDYASYSETVPARSRCSLEFVVPELAQACYQAFKFEPTNSHNLENGVAGDPYGLMELELIGELMDLAPTVTAFAQGGATWNSISFTGTVSGLGGKPSEEVLAESAKGWVEVSADESFSSLTASSPMSDVTAKMQAAFTVGSLAGNTSYYARLIVSNDLGYATTNVLSGQASTLSSPWECEGPYVSKRSGGVDVRFVVTSLHASPATVTLLYHAKPADALSALQSHQVTTAGEVSFVTSIDPNVIQGEVQVEVSAGGQVRRYAASVNEYWLASPVGVPTSISNTVNRTVITVSANTDVLELKSITALNDKGILDFSTPINDAEGSEFVILSMASFFKGNLKIHEVYLPEYVTALPASLFSQCYGLEFVRLPTGLVSIGESCFNDCIALTNVSPCLPLTVTAIGSSAFCGCTALSADPFYIPDGVRDIPSSLLNGCSSLTRIRLPDTLETVGGSAFYGATSVTNFIVSRFLPPSVKSIGTWAFYGTRMSGELVVDNPQLTSIGQGTFRDMSRITSLDFGGSGLASVNGQSCCFGMSSLTNVVFPKALKSVGLENISFGGCGKLRHIWFLGGAPTCGSEEPFPCNGSYIFHVPGNGRAGKSWREYMATHPDWVVPMSASDRESYVLLFGESADMPDVKLNLGGMTGFHYLLQSRARGLCISVR